MGFNAQAFATAFLEGSAKQINTRVAEARDYKRELKENAEASKGKIDKLAQLGNLAKSEISRLRALGFDDKYINAAIASGPKGLFDLSTAAQAEAKRRDFTPGQKFDEYEVESLIDYNDNFEYGDVASEEFYQMNTALSKPSLGSTTDPKRGVLKTLFGIDLDESVRSQLDKDAYYDGYSVMDINEMSKQEAYDSVAPGTYFSFTPTRDFDASSASRSFMTMLSAIDRDVSNKQDSGYYVKQAQRENAEDEIARARELAAIDKSQAIFNQVQVLTESNPTYLDKMGDVLNRYLSPSQMGELTYGSLEGDNLERKIVKDILTNTSAKNDIENIFNVSHKGIKHEIIVDANGTVKGLSVSGNALEEEEIDTILKDMALAGNIPNIKLASAIKASEEEEEREGAGLDESEVSTVPPRPKPFLSRITGVSLDYETRQKIKTGEMAVPDNLRVDEWDELFGDTHDPETGKALDKTTEALTPKEGSDTIDMRGMSDEEMDAIYDNLPIGAGYINEHGKLRYKKEER